MDKEKNHSSVTETRPKQETFLSFRLICLFFALLLIAGLVCLIFQACQKPIPAEITHVGKVTSRYHPRYRGSSSYTSYHADITVRYEENGEEKTAEMAGSWRSSWASPRVGNRTNIAIGILGKPVFWPDRTLQTISWVMIFIGGLFWGITLYLMRFNRRRSPYGQDDGNPMDQDPLQFVSETFVRQEDGSWKWSSEAGEAYDRYTGKKVMVICAIISAFLILMTAVADPEYLWIGLLTAAITMLIGAFVVFCVSKSTQVSRLYYHLTWDYITIGRERGGSFFPFRRVRSLETEGNHLVLHTRFDRGYVYVPAEDLEQLRLWMQRRIDRP